MNEFQGILLQMLAEHNEHLAQLIRLSQDPEGLADAVDDNPEQKTVVDGDIVRVRTKITERIWALVHVDAATTELKYAAFEDSVTGLRVVAMERDSHQS